MQQCCVASAPSLRSGICVHYCPCTSTLLTRVVALKSFKVESVSKSLLCCSGTRQWQVESMEWVIWDATTRQEHSFTSYPYFFFLSCCPAFAGEDNLLQPLTDLAWDPLLPQILSQIRLVMDSAFDSMPGHSPEWQLGDPEHRAPVRLQILPRFSAPD